MLNRILEPEVMDTAEDACDYDRMDHTAVNQQFVHDFVLAAERAGLDLGYGTLLDLGTGTALIPILYCRLTTGNRLVAVDAAASMLTLAAKNIREASLGQRIALLRSDAKRLPCVDGQFAAVVSNSLAHHIPNPIEVLREAVRVATSGGLLFFRDLLRPRDSMSLGRLIQRHAAKASPRQQELFANSLQAALTLTETRALVQSLGFSPSGVARTSDRHWTWSAVVR